MNIIDVIRKLIGRIEPIGETNEDNTRYENLREYEIVLAGLVSDVFIVAKAKDRCEYSMYRSGKYAYEILTELKRWIDNYFEQTNKTENCSVVPDSWKER
jgi:hypothetical protein